MSPPRITLENIATAPPGPVTIHLDHATYCAAAGDCRCTRPKVGSSSFDFKQKKRVVSTTNVRLPFAITLNARGTPGSVLEDLHPAVLKTPDGKRALEARLIRERRPAPESPPSPPAKKAVEKPADSTPKRSGKGGGVLPASPPSGHSTPITG